VQQLRIYEGNTLRAGLSNMHGLRHTYAQNRYEELTDWKAPAAGGPKAKTLTPEQQGSGEGRAYHRVHASGRIWLGAPDQGGRNRDSIDREARG
jgi:hypothetical protein